MSRIRFTTARDLFEAFPAARDDMQAKPTDEAPLAFLKRLTESETPEDAVAFCAYMLPRREAVWWGCQCVRGLGVPHNSEEAAALKAAEEWVREPEERSRREALQLGTDGSRNAPASWLALAAGWSGGNMMPAESPPVPAPPHLTAKAVRAAVLTAVARLPVKERRENLKKCLNEALRLAGGNEISVQTS